VTFSYYSISPKSYLMCVTRGLNLQIKFIKTYFISYTQVGENMAGIVKFMYVIIFIFLFLVSIKVEGKPFFYLFKYNYFSLHNIFYHFNNNFLFSFFITTGQVRCILDEDCSNEHCKFPLKPRCLKPYYYLRRKDGVCTCA
jgi:hypothetical protein